VGDVVVAPSGDDDADMRALSSCSESIPPEAVQLEYSAAGWLPILKESMEVNYLGLESGEFVVSSVRPGGQPVLAHRRGSLIAVLCELAESRGPLG
jgi:hypothetical protein